MSQFYRHLKVVYLDKMSLEADKILNFSNRKVRLNRHPDFKGKARNLSNKDVSIFATFFRIMTKSRLNTVYMFHNNLLVRNLNCSIAYFVG